MDIGLCMIIKNEESNIEHCLRNIVDLFAEVVIIDTGSTDKTSAILQNKFAIEPIKGSLGAETCFSLAVQRNRGFDMLNTPWILSLDADERIERKDLVKILSLDDKTLPAGLFCSWSTDNGSGQLIDDYKLFLFRKGYYKQGMVHENIQPHLRMTGAKAEWTDLLQIKHYPNTERIEMKEIWYVSRLQCARKKEPNWLRYDWFLAYAYYRQGQFLKAKILLQKIHQSRPSLFPVESLNASMILACILIYTAEIDRAKQVLHDAILFYQTVENDYEVKVNFRLLPWLKQALKDINNNLLANIEPYPFPY